MKLNNKGYMLVEIIVSSAIALIMAYFLIDITLTLVNRNNDYYVESTLLSDKNLITKELMDDLNNNDYLLTDIVVDNNAKRANFKFKKLSDNNILTKDLTINNNTLTYGNYTKKLSNDLTIKSINVTKDETKKQVYISIPAYTNYSDINYGINIVMPYTSEVNVVMPEIMFDVELTIVNGSIDNNKLRVKINNNAVFEGITPNEGYTLVKETDTCNGTLDSSGKYTISTIVDNKKCTLTLKEENNNSCDDSNVNSPDLIDGLIPVKYDEDSSSWVVADYNNANDSWYSYCDKKWANAVLVTESKRNSLNKDTNGNYIVGQTIGDTYDDGIKGFYVWIPRYSYRVWNISKQASSESDYAYNALTEGIEIKFEDGRNEANDIECSYNYNVCTLNNTSEGCVKLYEETAETCTGNNGDYYTHPAFTFGSKEIKGFWISKFELSSVMVNNSNSIIVSLPNLSASAGSNMKSLFNSTLNILYNNTNADSHMITNMEWGAIAYLANSEYGTCVDNKCFAVGLNSYIVRNYSDENYKVDGPTTGCGPQSCYGNFCSTEYGETCSKYDTEIGKRASTTRNIYGVYDMAGGKSELVAALYSDIPEKFRYETNSSKIFGEEKFYDDSKAKYITRYTYPESASTSNQRAYNRARLGDATAEVVLKTATTDQNVDGLWYETLGNMCGSYSNFTIRGKGRGDTNSGGIFVFDSTMITTSELNDYTSRAALVSLK